MLTRRWKTLERQRPQLRMVKWGELVGALFIVGRFVDFGSIVFGLILMVGFGIWGYSILNRDG
jgi:hypothetical protein